MKAFEGVCRLCGLKIKAEHLILYLCLFILVAAVAWLGKKIIWKDLQTSVQLKLTVVALASCAALPLTWLLRRKVGLWIKVVQEHITPLIWLFTTCLMLSLMLAGYNMLGKDTGKEISHRAAKSNTAGEDKKTPQYTAGDL